MVFTLTSPGALWNSSTMSHDPAHITSKPFLKWAGGKQKLVPTLSRFLDSARATRLVEPFVGSGAVFMGTTFQRYLLCDTNPDLIGLFNSLKHRPESVIQEASSLFLPELNTEEAFYRLRNEFNSLASEDIRKSAIFIYLNKHAFNGLCRYNSKGQFNVPFGRYSSPTLPLKELQLFAKKARLAEFKCQSFEQTFSEVSTGDVVYCDPPYVPLSPTASFTAYSKGGFGEREQIELADRARQAAHQGFRVVISNHDTDFTRRIYSDADILPLDVHRSISSKSSTRGAAKEVIAVFSKTGTNTEPEVKDSAAESA